MQFRSAKLSFRNLEVKIASFSASFLLYVCSETHICKMSQKSAGPHFENCAFRVGRIAKTEKMEKMKLENKL